MKKYQMTDQGQFQINNTVFGPKHDFYQIMRREEAENQAIVLPYSPAVMTPGQQRARIDALRRSAYSARCAPLLEEAQMKRHLGLVAEADALEAQAYQERLVIQQEHPWPVETTP